MKVIILAGGYGTRISEETETKPKPMVLIGSQPVLWHIMNIYAKQKVTDFIVATGYKGDVIHDWVRKVDTPWNITPIDTGLETSTGGRIKLCLESINDSRVYMTYGDGVGNINLANLLTIHNKLARLATITAVRPPARFGVLQSQNGEVTHFGEKSQADAGWINGGFFVLEREIINWIEDLSQSFELNVLPNLVEKRQLGVSHHEGFWQPMDTLREKNLLSELASHEQIPWLQI